MQNCEQLDDPLVRTSQFSQAEAIGPHPSPVRPAMDAIQMQRESCLDQRNQILRYHPFNLL
jgi:hypothetical protein